MSRFQYFVAASLDGFIATAKDDLAWLLEFDGFEGGKESYESFMDGVGCIVMGGETYAWLMKHEPGKWPYPSTPCHVFTRHEHTAPAGSDITFVRGPVREFIQDFKDAAGGKNVWVVGGGNLAAQFAAAGYLDELILSVIPVVLGDGKRLLPLEGPTAPLELTASRTLGRGIVELRYNLNPADTAG
ncbi:dihydrofolate reductase family protein [Pseudarthrobacter sulfonivorans]|uniref:dihydrofolate reductase family protein n=1 Tax=Pseudarthrobacter sulfonivorans TaxID=121292 RepID=UPI00285A0E5E|nr:dihydrofolate reductase family protein [Pseudarthrobacter sulfonivorans]MDR6416075.1 dihydrofolate reductase [Pseudarthrobacter sulfonivorans]